MNARRSLSCLADQYLHREGITYCRDAPRDAKKISEILVARKIFTERSAACLQRAIELRNQAEHKYRAISLQEAQDVVHLVHMTVEFTVKGSSPFYAVGGYGLIDGGVGSGKNGIYANFRGWGTCRIVAVPFVERPWIGVVLPGSTDVVIRRVFLDQFKVADYMNVLKILDDETQFPRAGVSSSANLWDALYKKAGLLP
ncbi:MAG TPA: hypothetical protein VM680_09095 [Verrucomicrobiae bacterium]|nr:hypothetical protein [Verrucomicrobiae bacterium]